MADAILLGGEANEDTQPIIDEIREQGFEVVLINDGDEAARLAKGKGNIFAAILNSSLPHKNALDVSKEIRNNKKTSDMPIYVLQDAAELNEEEYGAAGVDRILVKPYRVGTVLMKADAYRRNIRNRFNVLVNADTQMKYAGLIFAVGFILIVYFIIIPLFFIKK